MVQAGWYQDPQDSTQLRYWDGSTWTQHYAPNSPPAGGDSVPWSPAGMASSAPAVPERAMAAVSDPGDAFSWLRRCFSVVGRAKGAVGVLGFAIPFVASILLGLLLFIFLFGIGADRASYDGPSGPAALVILVLALLLLVAIAASVSGLAHNLYWLQRGAPATISTSLQRGFRRLPVALGYSLAIGLITTVVLSLLVGLLGVVPPIAGPVFLLLGLSAWVYFSVKLAFLPVSVAVVPSGVSAFSATMDVSENRFVFTGVRILLLTVSSFAVNLLSTPLGLFFGYWALSVDSWFMSVVFLIMACSGFVLGFAFIAALNFAGTADLYIARLGPAEASPTD